MVNLEGCKGREKVCIYIIIDYSLKGGHHGVWLTVLIGKVAWCQGVVLMYR